jgi:hypothetical protein
MTGTITQIAAQARNDELLRHAADSRRARRAPRAQNGASRTIRISWLRQGRRTLAGQG